MHFSCLHDGAVVPVFPAFRAREKAQSSGLRRKRVPKVGRRAIACILWHASNTQTTTESMKIAKGIGYTVEINNDKYKDT